MRPRMRTLEALTVAEIFRFEDFPQHCSEFEEFISKYSWVGIESNEDYPKYIVLYLSILAKMITDH